MRLFVFYFISVFFIFGQFDNVGTSAANFLKIGVGGRASGLAGATTADVNGPTALYWNPAGIASVKKTEISINQTDWIFDLKHSYLAVVVPMGRIGNMGISLNYLDMGTMERTTEIFPNGDGTTFSASNLAAGMAYSKSMSDRFNVGIQIKTIHESISYTSASALALDAGSLYTSRFSGLKVGMSITNFGTKMKLSGTDQKIDVDPYEDLDGNPDVVANLRTEEWPIPMTFRLGLSFKPIGPGSIINSAAFTNTLNIDYCDSRDLNPYFSFGSELKAKELICFRAGIKRDYLHYNDSTDNVSLKTSTEPFELKNYVNRFSWGIGLSSKNFKYIPYNLSVDYSVSDMGRLGVTSQIGLIFKL